jgi:hypothetical protein
LPLQDAGIDEDLEVIGDGGLAETNDVVLRAIRNQIRQRVEQLVEELLG